jgi:hypothetical protein
MVGRGQSNMWRLSTKESMELDDNTIDEISFKERVHTNFTDHSARTVDSVVSKVKLLGRFANRKFQFKKLDH